MNGYNYFMPNMFRQVPMGYANIVPYALNSAPRGILGKLGVLNNGIKGINWGGLLNNASKTLGVINQAIPIVKQAGPMLNNIRSMVKLATAFKNETSPKNTSIKKDIEKSKQVITNNTSLNNEDLVNNNYMPNFFIN